MPRQWTDNFDQWIDNLPHESHRAAFDRACSDLGWERDLTGAVFIVDGDLGSQEFADAIDARYKQMYLRDLKEILESHGRIRADHVDRDGEIGYVIA
jgi:hypothetical protein